jgi:predicted dehydrogenase
MSELYLRQTAILPKYPRPIISIGLGGIVHDAHYPAYKIAGFKVYGGFDLNRDRALMMQNKFDIPVIYQTLQEAVNSSPDNAIFDVAVPGNTIVDILKQLPDGSAVLIQKPMGDDLNEARKILQICRQKKLTAAVNFQLRYAPFIIAARDMIDQGMIGEIYDIEARMQVNTPWHLWPFLFSLPRVEILYHSIHYVDLIRSFLGTPQGVYAKTMSHPIAHKLQGGTRSMIIMDYGNNPRVNVMTNHNHSYGNEKQQSYFKFEGSKGAIKIRAGLNMNYPDGVPDRFEYYLNTKNDRQPPAWQTLDIQGSWFPEAFIGTMASIMRKVDGETDVLPTSVDDAFQTMAVVESAYESSLDGGKPIPQF